TYWQMIGQFPEDTVRVFAAELGCALGPLPSVEPSNIWVRKTSTLNLPCSSSHHSCRCWDLEAFRAYLIMFYWEVLSGGPYNHAADWWSLGILLFSLATGKFPVAPEPDHCSMLRKVRSFPYEMPLSLSSPLALLITELLCKTPSRRLRTLDRFQRQTFFRGSTFDLDLLQRQPMEVTDETSECPRFGCFLCKLKHES
uniref:Ribosomal protein S6 kinase related b n=1 Tax=Pundamilia nyererei TaxID=303518 RepID=A0A3B4H189_9CICH